MIGLVESSACCALLAILTGLFALYSQTWLPFVWALLCFRRALSYQVTCAVVLGIAGDILSAAPFGSGIGLLAGALLVANLLSPRSDERWQPGHALFCFAALSGGWFAMLVLSLLGNASIPGWKSIAAAIAAVLIFLAATLLAQLIRKPTSHRCHPANLARYDR